MKWINLVKVALVIVSFLAMPSGFAKPLTPVHLALLLQDNKPGMIKPVWPMVGTAANLALEDYRERLTKRGLDVTFQTYRVKEAPMEAATTIKEVLAGDTIGGIGLEVSAYAVVGGKALVGTNYVMVSPYASSSDLLAFYPNVLLISAVNDKMARVLEKFVTRDLKPSRIAAIVSWDQNYSKNFYERLSEDFRKNVQLFKVLEDHSDSDAIATKVMALNPEVVLLPNLPGSSAPYINALSARGFRGSFIGGDTWGEDDKGDFVRLTKDVAYDGYTIRQYSLHHLSPKALALKKRLQQKSNEEFRIVAMLYYDAAVYLMERLLELDSEPSRQALRDSVLRVPFQNGTSGKSCFGSSGCAGLELNVLKVNGNGFSSFKTYAE